MTNKILAIIQARMGSSRLPNKVMRQLGQKRIPVIALLLTRLSKARLIDEVVLASSTNSENDTLCDYVSSLGYRVFRGDENDVLKRFSQAAVKYQGDTIVRITGDSPLIDSELCDQLIRFHQQQKADYSYLSERFCEGVDCEVISLKSLLNADKKAKKASEREHVTLYSYNNRDNNHCVMLENSDNDSAYRFTLDNIEDAQLIEHLVNHFGNDIADASTKQIKKYLDDNPQVYSLNQSVIRNEGLLKSLAAESVEVAMAEEDKINKAK